MEFAKLSVDLVAAVILFGLLQLLILLYFFAARKSAPANASFCLFLGVLLLAQVETFLNHSGLMGQFPHLLNTSPPLLFLLGPLLLWHSRKKLGETINLKTFWPHLVPFVFYLGYSYFFFAQPEAFKYDAFARSFQPDLPLTGVRPIFDTDPLNIQGLVVVELISLHMVAYGSYLLWMLYKKPANRSKKWLWFVNSLLMLAGIILFLAQGGIINGNRFLESLLPQFSADLFPTLATYALSIYLINRSVEVKTRGPKYSKSALSPELKAPRAAKIHQMLEKEQPYLAQDFSLQKLAELCQMSPHHLSQILNEQMQMRFFELTNKYRIEAAKAHLSTVESSPKMEQLAYEVGYRSKSTFYKAFKEQTGHTPAQFYQKQLSTGFSRPE